MPKRILPVALVLIGVGCVGQPEPLAGDARPVGPTASEAGKRPVQRVPSSDSQDAERFSVSHLSRQVALSPERPTDDRLGITLLRVSSSGRVFIRVDETGEVVSATAGKPFLTKPTGPYGVRHFGESGLVVRTADGAGSTAVLEARWAD